MNQGTLLNSICLAGVTMAEHCDTLRPHEKLQFGVGRIKMKDVIYSHPYNIIAQGTPYQRYISVEK